MIHSLAGGSFKEKKFADFAKVQIIEGMMAGSVLWYILPNKGFNVGDTVIVPLGANNNRVKAKILKIENNILEGQSPIPFNKAKEIICKSDFI